MKGLCIITAWKASKYGVFFWSVFSCIRTVYGEIQSISPYSVRMQENTDQKKLRIWTLFTQCMYERVKAIFEEKLKKFTVSRNSEISLFSLKLLAQKFLLYLHCLKYCQNTSFLWSAFSRIRTELKISLYGKIWVKETPYSAIFYAVLVQRGKIKRLYLHSSSFGIYVDPFEKFYELGKRITFNNKTSLKKNKTK